MTPSLHDSIFYVDTLVGSSVETYQTYPDCDIIIDGHDLTFDLIILNFHDFDAILAIDWLVSYDARVIVL